MALLHEIRSYEADTLDTELRRLSVPSVPSVRYQRNFIQTCVCELRFPSLLELESKPPTSLQQLLRKEYPLYEEQKSIDIGAPGQVRHEGNRYLFRSKNRKWSVLLRSFSIALETTAYKDFDDFTERLSSMLEKSSALLDTDFFIRVGLRYINRVPVEDGDLEGWINSALVLPLTSGALGDVTKYFFEGQGLTDFGLYSFRHGTDSEGSKVQGYYLDYDYFAEGVSVDETLPLVKNFNQLNFSFFSWSLGQKALDWLGPGIPKKKT